MKLKDIKNRGASKYDTGSVEYQKFNFIYPKLL